MRYQTLLKVKYVPQTNNRWLVQGQLREPPASRTICEEREVFWCRRRRKRRTSLLNPEPSEPYWVGCWVEL